MFQQIISELIHIFAAQLSNTINMAKYGTLIWIGLIAIFTALLIIPQTHLTFIEATTSHPYLMGFIKFAILSTMGEFLAARLVYKRWQMIKGVIPKMLIWGVLGVLIVMMFSVYADGVAGAINKGLLWTGGNSGSALNGFLAKLLNAFYISAIMNLTFAPLFMAAHLITDTWIDARFGQKMTIAEAVSVIDWSGFIKFVVGKTIPLFWIPAHTITFLLPDTYKVIFAASLSIVLGLILSFAKMRSARV